MPLITLTPRVASKKADADLLKKAKAKKKEATKSSSNAIIDIINEIRKDVNENLGEFIEQYQIIYEAAELDRFIKNANTFGYISIDTETEGLNPITDKIAGLCLYSPNQKPAYVPINHVDYITGNRYEEQLTELEIKPILDKLTAKIIMFNASFDIRVIRHQIGSYLTCWWDCLLAAKLMNENETRSGLKVLHEKYVLGGSKAEKTFSDLFGNIVFTRVPIECAFLYAAHDAIITYELQQFQAKYLNPNQRQDLADVYDLFMNIEMPCVDVVCDMEDAGVDVDMSYAMDYLSPKYHKIADEKLKICYDEIEKHRDKIDAYLEKNPDTKLQMPMNIDSPVQLAIFLYDILKEKPRDKKNPRGTGEDILLKIGTPFTEAVLDYRGAQKLLRTYIDKMPNIVLADGRVHCHFNQYGAKTGRFSSSDPINMQNIPSSNTEIRKMFIGGTIEEYIENEDEVFTFDKSHEVELADGTWIFVEQLSPGDKIQADTGNVIVTNIEIDPTLYGKVKIIVAPAKQV